MAVPKLESYGSTFVRYSIALVTDQTPRWVEKSAHDGSYEGVINTTKAFLEQGLADEISVFVRGDDTPKLIYTTEGRQFPDAITAITYGREIGRRKAIEGYKRKRKIVEDAFREYQPQLLDRLQDWQNMYEQEAEYFQSFNTGNDKKIL